MGTLAGHPYVTRTEWDARPPTRQLHPATEPAPRLYIHHTGTEQHGPDGMRAIQRYHQTSKGWADIAYELVIDDDGTIYEGRGVHVIGGATRGENATSKAVCLMGNFETHPPTPRAMATLIDLACHGRDASWWIPTMHGHRDSAQADTVCPGQFLYQLLPDARALVATQPSPAPTPTDPQEDDVFTYGAPNQPIYFAAGGRSAGLNEATDLVKIRAAVSDAGGQLPHFDLDAETYAAFRAAFPSK